MYAEKAIDGTNLFNGSESRPCSGRGRFRDGSLDLERHLNLSSQELLLPLCSSNTVRWSWENGSEDIADALIWLLAD
jgi:hypothetical protein